MGAWKAMWTTGTGAQRRNEEEHMTKVALIGENSMEFARGDVVGLCVMDGLPRLELALHDPNRERLQHMAAMARMIVAQLRPDVTVTMATERAGALDGADYVVTELEVGGFDATRLDFAIASHYGVRQTDGHTIGIGGIFRGLRTIPVSVSIALDMVRLCPNAVLLNYSNPMAMTTWAIYETSPAIRVFGLCHGIPETHELLAQLAGIASKDAEFVTAGVNHQAFVLRFDHRGQSMLPKVHDLADKLSQENPVGAELLQRFGFFSTEQSPEYLPWIMRHDGELQRLRVAVGRHEADEEETQQALALERAEIASGIVTDLRYEEAIAPLFIHSAETGTEREIYVSARNSGRITNLPDDSCVETSCRVGTHGTELAAIGALPAQLAALNRSFLNVVELTVRAVLDGDRQHIHQAALMDPNTAATLSARDIAAMCDDLFAAHRPLLPPALAGDEGSTRFPGDGPRCGSEVTRETTPSERTGQTSESSSASSRRR
jgi:alpha-galactosidase